MNIHKLFDDLENRRASQSCVMGVHGGPVKQMTAPAMRQAPKQGFTPPRPNQP